ncbi:uncharacterized protein DUF4105 [Advenella incenata]|jgi:uncharacterized membrane protein YoaK (UPF0700 family)|uniref:Uncharacterized protein DUF4105 n=1 Tax=Advenella incenata TaxID=267800 RepID=A0A4Q7VFG6_9BURK|nr:DUF4105 domain-containing protein [Advenella incenata]RZT94412.1 uncharacterized protein DUF4105 [Advenella incenata]
MIITLAVIVIAVFIWGALALWVQFTRQKTRRGLLIALWALVSALFVAALLKPAIEPLQTIAGITYTLSILALVYWWRSIRASNDRNWIPDVSRQVHGSLAGNTMTIENVRNFIWHSPEHFTEQWETRQYDLSKLASVDLALSYWSGPAIAHALVSFGFSDDQYLVFSVEIRRKVGDAFSELGGFFKMYELSIVAADEKDVLFVRSNIRQEDGYLYRVHMAPAARQSLLLAYLDEANRLVHTPRFYHTITGNCTTLIFRMMDRIVPGLPLNWRLLASGYLPEYLYKVGALQGADSIKEYRSRGRYTDRARAMPDSSNYSGVIRDGVPGI